MTAEMVAKATLHQRAMHEVKEFVILALYLYITLGAVILMKTAVLHTVGIEVAPWGIAIVKAMVLAKFMLLGFAMMFKKDRKTTNPLVWPTLQMAFAFLGLLIIMTIVEEIAVGLFHDRSIAASLGETVRNSPRRNARRLPDHVASAHTVFRIPDPQRGARRRSARADVFCRTGTTQTEVSDF